ncbi:hypothetical protein RDWZM_002263 [Blomia tropicalis]|uniref:Dscam n=1 Tax=Blomia tropicalis TaxID=40697 RepID=A0A9Q0RPS0_BLOTA|nr:hypothetical protein RDWZM_002263 [Blomia tropicalis]
MESMNGLILCTSEQIHADKPLLSPLVKSADLSEKNIFVSACNIASGIGPFTFRWFKNDQPLNETGYRKIDNTETFSMITIKSLTKKDAGIYKCQVTNLYGSDSSSTQLNIKVFADKPKLLHLPQENGQFENMSFVLSCMVSSGSQPFQFEWIKDDRPLENDNRHKIENHETISLLSLRKLHRKDTGSYTCKVNNQFGTDSTSTRLLVKDKPNLVPLTKTFGLFEKSNTRIMCNIASGNSPITFRWFKDDKQLNENEFHKVDVANEFSILTLMNLKKKDAGKYTCQVNNSFGSDSSSTQLDIKGSFICFLVKMWRHVVICFIQLVYSDKPKLVSLPKNYELFENDNNRVVCNVASGSSPFTFHWLKDNLPLSENQRRKIDVTEDFSILSLKNVTKQDSGSYICQVNNSFGSDSSSTKLHVKGSFENELSENMSSVLSCMLSSGSQPVHFEWLKDNLPLEDRKRHKIENHETVSLLSLQKLQRKDSGSYTCNVKNQFGTDSTSTQLLIKVVVNLHLASSEKPQLIPLNKNFDLIEKSSYRIICSIASGNGPFTFRWFKNDQPLQENKFLTAQFTEDISILSFKNLTKKNSGNYKCQVNNSDGSDSSSTQLNIKGYDLHQDILTPKFFGNEVYLTFKMYWFYLLSFATFLPSVFTSLPKLVPLTKSFNLTEKIPPSWLIEPVDVHMNKNKDGSTESKNIQCQADGSPKPTIKWITSKGVTIESEKLDVNRFRTSNVDSYECVADNGVGEPLRKTIKVSFMIPAKFEEKYSNVKVKRGESARLICNATGDQPLNIVWTRANIKLDKLGSNYEILDTTTPNGIKSELFIQTTQVSDAGMYKCFAENEHGKDEQSIKLEVFEVPDQPKNVRVKEVWSRTVSIIWSESSSSGNLPIKKYTIQYWRHQNAPQRLHELVISGSQTSILIKDLSPGQAYELSVIAENEIGKGPASSTITFTTGEEEPSAPPNDIVVDPLGPTTIRVTWRSPPIENWNGEIKGYYLGYRKTREPDHPFVNMFVSAKQDQNVRPTVVSLMKKNEINFHEYFIRQLEKGTEYTIIIKAYNSAGSGPNSHEIMAHTFDGDLPPPVQLDVIDTTDDTISLRWHQKYQTSDTPVTSYSIHYQIDGEQKWKDLPIVVTMMDQQQANNQQQSHHFNSFSFVVQGLEPNRHYKIYVTAVNRFGVGDPSNVVTARTFTGMAVLQHENIMRPFGDGSYYLQPLFFWPVLIASVIIIVVLIIAYACIRKARNDATNAFSLDATTLNKRLAAGAVACGTTPRYIDFEPNCSNNLNQPNGTMLMGEQTAAAGMPFPTPYATLPMGGVGEVSSVHQ